MRGESPGVDSLRAKPGILAMSGFTCKHWAAAVNVREFLDAKNLGDRSKHDAR